ncbi:MAG: ATP-binding cassette domain-containing protein, partial [Oscillibacter sp.]|nr:ATP-binding cassette domain-containing protein [Oscillibacter sp.]
KAAVQAMKDLSEEYGLYVEPGDVVREISVGLQQRVEILKTLYRGADVLILDEPTAVLTPQETDELFAILRRVVREKDMTVIIITHKLYEVMAISDRVGVMRQGKMIAIDETKNVTERSLAAMMVGRDVVAVQQQEKAKPGEEKIRVENLEVDDNRGLPAVRGLSLSVRAGEVLGIAAIEGNGQSELIEAITGLRPYTAGTVTINGTDVAGKTPGEIRKLGLAHVPEDRLATGVSPDADITDNLLVGKHKNKEFTKFGFHQSTRAIKGYAQEIFDKFDIRASGLDARVGSLSGGNMQKVVIAREFSYDADVLVISQPTRGVDIGANEFIHSRILEKRDRGAAVLLCSADLDEVFRLSDRIITIYEGRITGHFEAGTIEKAEIGYYMTGDRGEGVTNEA